MVAVPRNAVGMMLGESRGGQQGAGGPGWQLGGGGRVTLLPGVDGDAHFQEGPQVDTWMDRARCHQRHFRALVPPHPMAQGPRGLGRGGVPGDLGRFPGAHVPVRKAKPTSMPSRFCSVSRLCGVAVSQIISPSAPRPVSRLNWGREAGGGPALLRQGGAGSGGTRTEATPKAPSPGRGGSPC